MKSMDDIFKEKSAQKEVARLNRKILKLEKRLDSIDVRDNARKLSELSVYANEISTKYQLLMLKTTVYDMVSLYLKGDEKRFNCLSNILASFDDDPRLWAQIDELTLEEVVERFSYDRF